MFVIYRICGGSESFIITLFSSCYESFGVFFYGKIKWRNILNNLKIQFFIGFIVAMTGIVLISFNGQNLELNPKIIESSMLTIYKTSELYQEIQKGNWKEESEIEKLIELKTLVENLTINTRIVTDGASNLIQVRGNLPAEKKKLIKHLEYQISNADEASLREYRVNLRHL